MSECSRLFRNSVVVMQVLCGDIGGTNSRLMVADVTGTTINPVVEQQYRNKAFNGFDDVLDDFLRKVTTVPESACFAVAGQINQGEVTLTNLPWRLTERQLQDKFSLRCVSLINDFSAVAYGISALKGSELHTIQEGKAEDSGSRVVLGAGTGLGVAQLIKHEGIWQVIATEGGHMAFSPVNDEQRDILQWLSSQQDYVSNEDVLSGPGLVRLYQYYVALSSQGETASVRELLTLNDPAAAISQLALRDEDKTARQALLQFIDIYGVVAGNLALLTLPFGGVFLAGGIAPKIAEFLSSETFLASFSNKGMMSKIMSRFPIYIIMNDNVGLLGAALYAYNIRKNER